jgi:hypothetical protein
MSSLTELMAPDQEVVFEVAAVGTDNDLNGGQGWS